MDGKPGILMNRYAQGSKDVVRLDKGKIKTVGESELLNERSIADLEKIRDTMIKNKIKIDDLQFLVGTDGRVVVADPLKVYHGVTPSKNNLDMISQLIRAARRTLGK